MERKWGLRAKNKGEREKQASSDISLYPKRIRLSLLGISGEVRPRPEGNKAGQAQRDSCSS